MSAGSKNCGVCGHPNTGDAMFCSKCGGRLPPRAAAPPPEPPAAEVPAAEVPTAPVRAAAPKTEPERPRRRRVAGGARTMLGVAQSEPPPKREPAPEAVSAEPVHAAEPPKSADPAHRIAGSARTMLGMPAPDRAAVAAAVQQAKADARSARDARAVEAVQAVAEEVRSARARDESGAAGADTLLDSEAASSAPVGDAAPSEGQPSRSPAFGATNRTMLGQPAPKVAADEPASEPAPRISSMPPGPRGRAPVVYPSNTGEEDALTLPKKRSPAVAIVALAVGLVALAVGGGALAYRLFASGSDLRASVVQGADGEVLEIEVPGAAQGTRVRFHGTEQPLAAGRARFPLRADDLALGDNELSVDVIAPDGSIESETIELNLDMRVRADLGALASVPPAFDVVVEAPLGSEVALDGEPLELDGSGRGTRRFDIDSSDANAEGMVEHVVRYRVAPPEGESAQGELRTRIPLSSLQIDRPGEQLVTDRASVEVAGAVAPGSSVSVAGQDVEVRLGRFLTTHPLPAVGEHTVEVIARAPGKAPRVARIRIRRVADLGAEAASFEVDPDLTYARIAQNPATYRGRRVAFEGVVYNVEVRNGTSVLQLLVDGCPQGERCPLWVTYSAATDAELRSRVRVLGTVAGEQQFRSQRGEIRSVPRVDATFVLPAAPAGGGGRR